MSYKESLWLFLFFIIGAGIEIILGIKTGYIEQSTCNLYYFFGGILYIKYF